MIAILTFVELSTVLSTSILSLYQVRSLHCTFAVRADNANPIDPLSWLQVSKSWLLYLSIQSSSTRRFQERLLTPVLADDHILEGLAKDGKMD